MVKCFDCENKIQIKEMGALCQCTVVRPNVFKLLESRQCEHYKEQEVEERLKCIQQKLTKLRS